MDDSILNSVKKLLGIAVEDHCFDCDIIIHINSVFSILRQLGVGPIEGFSISSEYETWEDFIMDDTRLSDVKTYMYLRVKLMFDPPASSSIAESYSKMISEFEWRMNIDVDPPAEISEVNQNG